MPLRPHLPVLALVVTFVSAACGMRQPTATPAGPVDVVTTGVAAARSAGADGSASGSLGSVEEAISSGDLCAVYDALSGLAPRTGSSAEMADQLDRIAEAMLEADALAPDGLRADWDAIAEAAAAVSRALREEPDDLTAAGEAFDDPHYAAAERHLERWVGDNCG